MAHYPPFNARRADSDYTALMRDARADVCVYGHLHGVRGAPLTAEKDGITYRLTSCDMLGNKLALIAAPPSPS
jgi:predicted phosphohydrolase